MNKTKMSIFLALALLITQPTQIKSGIITGSLCIAAVVVVVYGWVKYDEKNKNESLKVIDSGTKLATDGVQKAAQEVKKFVEKA